MAMVKTLQIHCMKIAFGKTKDYYITGHANPIFCAVGLR